MKVLLLFASWAEREGERKSERGKKRQSARTWRDGKSEEAFVVDSAVFTRITVLLFGDQRRRRPADAHRKTRARAHGLLSTDAFQR